MVIYAISKTASEVRFEPDQDSLHVGVVRDGQFESESTFDKAFGTELARWVKVMTGLDQFQSDQAQSGQLRVRIARREFQTELFTEPGMFGERIVLRFLEPPVLSQVAG